MLFLFFCSFSFSSNVLNRKLWNFDINTNPLNVFIGRNGVKNELSLIIFI